MSNHSRPNKLGELEKTVLKAARDLTGDCVIANDDWKRIEDAMGRQNSMELVLIIGYYNYLIRVISGLGIEVEPEYRVLLEPYQPPKGKAWR